jgi:protein-S-isoprenylcysteine O-methyltransferase Ste14
MPPPVHSVLIALSLIFLAVGMYHRIRAAQSGDKLDRTKEGWPILISLRLAGFVTFGSTAAWICNPSWFFWAAFPVRDWVRWVGVGGFFIGISWLIWMFISLGTNLTDTVVTRRNAHFVDHGPYQYVRNQCTPGLSSWAQASALLWEPGWCRFAQRRLFSILARRTRTEEAFLIARFGDQYRTYMTRVGRFFPRLT